jgi:hypothetical protein
MAYKIIIKDATIGIGLAHPLSTAVKTIIF